MASTSHLERLETRAERVRLRRLHRWERLDMASSFFFHLGVYLLVNTGLFALNISRNPDRMWSYWVIAGWGIGILFHAFRVFCPLGRRD